MPISLCPSREELFAFVHGTANLANPESIAEHLDTCSTCDSLIGTLESAEALPFASPDGECTGDEGEFVAEAEFLQAIAAIGNDHAFNKSRPTGASAAPSHAGRVRDYELLEELGSGGMGTVYRALHTQIDKVVAIKMLPTERMRDPQAVARFRREMKAVGRLDHPQIVRALDGGNEGERHFLVMEYINGIDLAELVSRVGPLAIPDACEIIRQAAQGLQHVHVHALVHRDIKPSNIMLAFGTAQTCTADSRMEIGGSSHRSQSGTGFEKPTVKLLDLGLALLGESNPATVNLTGARQVMGTVDYMAPEQCESSHNVDIRADLYSLGCTLYKLLTGDAPFSGQDLDTPVKKALAHVRMPPPAIATRRPDIPESLASIVQRLLAKSPADRFANPAEVAAALEPLTAGCNLPALAARARTATSTDRPSSFAAAKTNIHSSSASFGSDAKSMSGGSGDCQNSGNGVRGSRPGMRAVAVCIIAACVTVGVWSGTRERNAGTPGNGQSAAALAPADAGGSTEDGLNASGTQVPESVLESAPQRVTVDNFTESRQPADKAEKSSAADAPAREAARVYPTAIFSFEERGAGVKGYGAKISDFLLASLAGNPDLYFVDRTDLKKILDEQELRLSGLTKPDEAVQIGRLTGAKILISGSVLELDKTLVLSAKIMGTETGRLVTASIKGKTSDDLADLAEQLAVAVEKTIAQRSGDLVAKPVPATDRILKLKKSLEGKRLPTVWIQVAERHIGQATIDPAAETELALWCESVGFTVIDHKDGNRKHADVFLEGEAFSEFATRTGNLVSAKARVEVKAIDRKTGERLASDRQTEIAIDLAEQVAGKTALQNAAVEIAERLLPKIVKGAK